MHVNPAIASLLQSLNHPALPGIDLSLERMRALLAVMGNPQEKLPPVIHVAGTNGKGSTVAFLRAIYTAQGYRVHAYTSPHLVRFNERIVLAGHEISDVQLVEYLTRIASVAQTIPVTFFEATTALAFLAFAEHKAEILLLETGLGGRLDATNVVTQPVATVITPIAMDHMEFLGPTLAHIAREKAGIIKPEVPCISASQLPEVEAVLRMVAHSMHAPFMMADQEWHGSAPQLRGDHQRQNAALAARVTQSVTELPVSMEALSQGIQSAHWPARLQPLHHGPLCEAWGVRGEVMLDGGHNAHAAAVLAQWVRQQPVPVTLLCGMMARKDAQAFFAPLAGVVREIITIPVEEEGAYAPDDLAQIAVAAGATKARVCHTHSECIALLQACDEGALLIAGSLFLAGQILKNHG